MIVKGKSCAHAGNLANYLLRQGKNELVRFHGVEGTLSQDLSGAFLEMAALAELTKCKNYLYHASINPKDGEQLTPEQWARAVEIIEKNLHLEGHQKATVEHVKNGKSHYHLVWSRIDPENLKAQNMGWNYVQHEKAERLIEQELGLEHVQGRFIMEPGEKAADRGPTHYQIERAKRDGFSVYEWRKEIRAIEKATATAPELIAALEDKGYLIARGDKVPFMILDPAGKPQRMAQNLGLRASEFRDRMAGIDPQNLPTVEEAQQRRQGEIEKEEALKDSQLAATLYDRPGMVEMQKDAMRHIKDAHKLLLDGPARPEKVAPVETPPKETPREKERRELWEAKKRQAEKAEREKNTANDTRAAPAKGRKQQEEQRRQEQQTKDRRKEEHREAAKATTRPNPARQKLEEARAKTEQTDGKQRQQSFAEALSNRRFTPSKSGREEDYDYERER